MALNLQRLFQWGKTSKPPYDLDDQPNGRPNDGDDLDAELDRVYANDTDLEERKLDKAGGIIEGDLLVQGILRARSTVSLETTEVKTQDNTILLNEGEAGAGVTVGTSGIEVDRGSSTNAALHWLESSGRWVAGLVGSESPILRLIDAVTTPVADRVPKYDEGGRLQSNPPQDTDDVVRKAELDAEITARQNADTSLETNKLSRDGSQAMTGNLNMDNKRITNLPEPAAVTDPARKQELDDLGNALNDQLDDLANLVDAEDATFLKLDGSRAMTGNLDLGTGHSIRGLHGDALYLFDNSDGNRIFKIRTGDERLLLQVHQGGNSQIVVGEGYDLLKRQVDASGNFVNTKILVDEENSPGAYGLQNTAADPKTSSNEFLLHQGNSPGAHGLQNTAADPKTSSNEFLLHMGLKALSETKNIEIQTTNASPSTIDRAALHITNTQTDGTAAERSAIYALGVAYGVRGISEEGTGIFGTGDTYGVYGLSDYKGVVGSANDYDFYASGGGVNYGPFTGAHEITIPISLEPEPGMVLATNYTRKRMKDDGTLSLSSTFPHCDLAASGDTPYCIYNGTAKPDDDHWAVIGSEEKCANGNALGEGWILATDRNGAVEKGDILVLGELPGYAHRLDPNTPITAKILSQILGKVIDHVDWSEAEAIEGSPYRKLLLPVIYMMG